MSGLRVRGAILVGLLLWGAVGAPERQAAAHGGVVWIDDNYGAFHLVVQTTPTANEREMRFTILVHQPGFGDPISDAQVRLRAALSDTVASSVAPVERAVPPEAGQAGFYDATVILPRYGTWRVNVQAQRGAGEAQAAFTLPVQPPPASGWPVWLLALAPLILAGIAAGILYWRGGRDRTGGAAPPVPQAGRQRPTAAPSRSARRRGARR